MQVEEVAEAGGRFEPALDFHSRRRTGSYRRAWRCMLGSTSLLSLSVKSHCRTFHRKVTTTF